MPQNSRSKSRRQIAWELIQKGVGKETISQLFEEEEPQEDMAARRYLEKKLGGRQRPCRIKKRENFGLAWRAEVFLRM